MTQVVTFRADEHDLARIAASRAPGQTTTDVLKDALRALEVVNAQARMRQESAQIMADPDQVAEIGQIQSELAALRAW